MQDLPCTQRLNQLVCTGAGTSYPDTAISGFITDNKVGVLIVTMMIMLPTQALTRRMFGEVQVEPRPLVTTKSPAKTQVTLVRSFGRTRYRVSTQPPSGGGYYLVNSNNDVDDPRSFVSAPLIKGQFASAPKFQRYVCTKYAVLISHTPSPLIRPGHGGFMAINWSHKHKHRHCLI